MSKKLKIIGICGSLRKNSYNKLILNIAGQQIPSNIEFKIVEIDSLPYFNEDLESNPPISVTKLRDEISSADAILFAVPEYNYSISGVLKNAIEWASRPYGQNAINQKVIAIMGATTGQIGTARAQYHLRQILVQTDSIVLNRPEVMISFVKEKFNQSNQLTDDKTLQKIKELVEALVTRIRL